MFKEIEAAATASATLWEHRRAIKSTLLKLYNRFKHGNIRIAVFGPGGVGKPTKETTV